MNNQFIEKSMWMAEYEAHNKGCYHNIELNKCYSIPEKLERDRAVRNKIKSFVEAGNVSLLPFRLSILRGDAMQQTKCSGRARVPMTAQLKGNFISVEDSIYKAYKPYNIQTGLWKVEGYQSYYAGSLGVSGVGGKIDRDNADLLVVHTLDWRNLQVFVFRGLAGVQKQLDYLPEVMRYLKGL